uniref:U6 snRNA-associated Sm-like protein LSm1 n=1 Tax=Timema californicum TaxID=61474 RepID=A0A7R9PD37_TIMCA|nr:unnamed protein product [Timema californicum]
MKEKLMVLLRDGRTLIGYLRSVDQFANLVLHRTIERIHVGRQYGDIPRGVFIVRGENVVLLVLPTSICGNTFLVPPPTISPYYTENALFPESAHKTLEGPAQLLPPLTISPIKPLSQSHLPILGNRLPFGTDPLKEDATPLIQVSVDDILDAQRREQEAKQDQERLLAKALKERGLNYAPDLSHDDLF